jgi:hypothetical protein
MKSYKLFYEYHPFDVDNIRPRSELIEANSLNEAFEKLEALKGKDQIEIFKTPSQRYYNE